MEASGITGLPSLCGLTVVGNVDELHFRMELAGERVAVRPGQPADTFVVDGLEAQVSTVLADEISPAARSQGGVGLLRMHAAWESARRSLTLGREVQAEELAIRTADHLPVALVWWFPSAGEEPSPATEGASAPDGAPAEPVPPAPVPAEAGATPAAAESPAPAAPAAPAAALPPASPAPGAPAAVPPADPAVPAAPAAPAAAPGAARPTGVAYVTAAFGPRVLALSVEGKRGERKADLVAKAEAWMATLASSPRFISAGQVAQEMSAATAAGQTCAGRRNAVLEP